MLCMCYYTLNFQARSSWHTITSSERKDSNKGSADSAPCTPESLDLEHDDAVSDMAQNVPALSELETGIYACRYFCLHVALHNYMYVYL